MSDYKIRAFNKETGNIIVDYPNMAPIAIDLPIDAGKYPTGDDLDAYIMGFIPTWHIERLKTIKAGVSNHAEIASLVTEYTEEELAAFRRPNMDAVTASGLKEV